MHIYCVCCLKFYIFTVVPVKLVYYTPATAGALVNYMTAVAGALINYGLAVAGTLVDFVQQLLVVLLVAVHCSSS